LIVPIINTIDKATIHHSTPKGTTINATATACTNILIFGGSGLTSSQKPTIAMISTPYKKHNFQEKSPLQNLVAFANTQIHQQ
jgi:hypothetical protein